MLLLLLPPQDYASANGFRISAQQTFGRPPRRQGVEARPQTGAPVPRTHPALPSARNSRARRLQEPSTVRAKRRRDRGGPANPNGAWRGDEAAVGPTDARTDVGATPKEGGVADAQSE